MSRSDPFAKRGHQDRPRRTPEHAPRKSTERWAAVLVLSCGIGVIGLLGVPRPVVPDEVPLPRVVRPLLLAEQRTDRERARAAWQGLSRNVRTVGELVRRIGLAEVEGDVEAVRLRAELQGAARLALQSEGEAPLLELRALQTELFLEALRRAERGGRIDTDLLELGGTLAPRWRTERSRRRPTREVADEVVVALYRMRWADLVGLGTQGALGPSLNDLRLFYRYRFTHADRQLGRRSRLEAQLEDVRALGRLDPSYPGDYAAGVVLFQLGAIDEALASFRAHLRAHPDGPWSLRARNYATACAARLFEE